ncbi:hypothetical protein ACOMHN_052431 [Nucella lapillus]
MEEDGKVNLVKKQRHKCDPGRLLPSASASSCPAAVGQTPPLSLSLCLVMSCFCRPDTATVTEPLPRHVLLL